MGAKRNTTLELIKLVASYMVVFIHIPFYGKAGGVMDTLARFAVPLFFLVSGYFSYGITPQKIKSRIKHVLVLLIVAVVSYTLYNLLFKYGINGFLLYLGTLVEPKSIVKLFVFNEPVCSEHLWYLFALVYVYVCFYFATVWHMNKKVMCVGSVSLLVLQLLLDECLTIIGISVPTVIIRNFALLGIPFFGIGLLVKKYEYRLRNTADGFIFVAMAIGFVESVLSRAVFGKNELYIGSLFILYALVVVFIKYPHTKCDSFVNAITGCSTYIYIFHIMISSVMVNLYGVFGVDYEGSVVLMSVHPIIVCLVSTAVAYLIVRIQNRTRKKS